MIFEKIFNTLNKIHLNRVFYYCKKFKIVTLVDVGSHKGEFLDYFIKKKKIRKILAFEPQSIPFEILKHKFKSNSRIKLFNQAVSNMNKKRVFKLNKLSSTSTFETINKKNFYTIFKNFLLNSKNPIEKKIILKTKRIEKFLKEEDLKNCFIKIDVEGHEYEVLRGLGKKIKNIQFIMIEKQLFNLYKRKEKAGNYLKKNNFYIIKKFTFPSFHFQDILYKNKNF